MVEMHLLSVNIDFTYNPVYALGVVTTFDRFMQGYQPESEKVSIFEALCQAVEQEPQRYRRDAERLQLLAKELPVHDLIDWLSLGKDLVAYPDLQGELQAIANNPKFKYSRLFAIGLFALLEQSDAEVVKDEKQRSQVLTSIGAGLHISDEKLIKDLQLYGSNLEKMTQALTVMADMVSADRKKREQRQQQASTPVSPPTVNE